MITIGPLRDRSDEQIIEARVTPSGRVAPISGGFYQVEGIPGPSLLGTGEVERIHSGSCQPLARAVHSDSISTVPHTPV